MRRTSSVRTTWPNQDQTNSRGLRTSIPLMDKAPVFLQDIVDTPFPVCQRLLLFVRLDHCQSRSQPHSAVVAAACRVEKVPWSSTATCSLGLRRDAAVILLFPTIPNRHGWLTPARRGDEWPQFGEKRWARILVGGTTAGPWTTSAMDLDLGH